MPRLVSRPSASPEGPPVMAVTEAGLVGAAVAKAPAAEEASDHSCSGGDMKQSGR